MDMTCLLSFSAILGYRDGSVGAAITAVVLIHSIIAGYVYVAWKEGSQEFTSPVKRD